MGENKRTSNFSSTEEALLLSLVQKFASLLENKKTDSGANNKKNGCWAEIETLFNSSSTTYRSAIILRRKYENMKKKTKKKFLEEKIYNYGTGGGPEKKTKIDDIDNKIQEILGTKSH